MKTDLSTFDNSWYKPGGTIKVILWTLFNALVMKNPFWLHSKSKVILLRMFGARIGKGVIFKPEVSIKYPWKLSIGDHCWIGEQVWIDNLAQVSIEDHVCISQGALLLCGNHNYKSSKFDLMIGEITLKEGAWIGAKTSVCGGVVAETHSVLSAGSVATKDLEAYTIYQGIPAVTTKKRTIES